MSEYKDTIMTVEDIMKVLPHRFPFLLVDRVVQLDDVGSDGGRVGRTVTAIKNVTINEPFFTGHFPHRPVMPGVLIVEAIAQTCALACARPGDPEFDVSIAAINKAKFRRPVVPGDTLVLKGELLKDRGKMLVLGGQALVGDQVVAEVELLAYVIPKSEL